MTEQKDRKAQLTFEGAIAGLGTQSGLRLVIGMWPRSPFGSFTDVMLQQSDGRRLLLAPTRQVAEFVSATYTFDDTNICPVQMWREGDVWNVKAGGLKLTFVSGRRTPLGSLLSWVPKEIATRPAWSAAIDPIARRVMNGVRTRGSAGGGRVEYYGALDQHRIDSVQGAWNGADFGGLGPVDPPVTFGFGSTPREPSLVRLVTTIRGA